MLLSLYYQIRYFICLIKESDFLLENVHGMTDMRTVLTILYTVLLSQVKTYNE